MKKTLFAGVMLLMGGSGGWAQNVLPSPEFCSLSQAVVGNVLGQLASVVLSGEPVVMRFPTRNAPSDYGSGVGSYPKIVH